MTLSLAVWAGAIPSASASALLLDRWEYRSPSSVGEDLRSVIHDGTQFIAVGTGGLMMTSTDGSQWHEISGSRDTGIEKTDFTRIVRTGDAWLAFGGAWFNNSFGGTTYSLDGSNWTLPEGSSSSRPLDAVYFDDQYLILSYFSFLDATDDLTEEPVRILEASWDGAFQAITVGNGRLVIVGTHGLTAYSDNGVDWTVNDDRPSARTLHDVTFLGDAFYAVGEWETILRSLDGITWSVVHNVDGIFPPILRSISRVGDLWIAVGDSAALRSTNGVDWEPLTTLPDQLPAGYQLFGIAAHDGRWVIVGSGGLRLTSTDGVQWSGAIPSERFYFFNLLSDGSNVVSSLWGGRSALTRDGVTWQTGTAAFGFSDGIVRFGGHYYSGSDDGLLRTPDGRTWEKLATAPSPGGVRFVNVAGNALFVGFADNSQWRTTDATDWEPMDLPDGSIISGVAGGGNEHVAITLAGICFSSTNGVSWTQRNAPASDLVEIVHGLGRFVARTSLGSFFHSGDGIDWEAGGPDLYERRSALIFTGQEFVVGGVGGQLAVSDDGITWDTVFTPLSGSLTAAARIADSLIIANQTGVIMQSTAQPPAGGLVNISTRARLASADETVIAGFSIAGGTKSVLIRGAGRSLDLGIHDPVFQLYQGSTEKPGNDDWIDYSDQDRLAATTAAVFAFPFSQGTAEAAGVFDLPAGTHTAVIKNKAEIFGLTLAEVYDADIAPASSPGRIVNLSARATVHADGAGVMIAGFVIRSGNPRRF